MLTTDEDATPALKVAPARPEKAMRDKGYSIRDVERLYAAIQGWESRKYGWKGTGRGRGSHATFTPGRNR